MNTNRLLAPIPVRFNPGVKTRVQKTARRFNLNASEIIRRAVEKQLPVWESGDVIMLESSEPVSR